MGNHFLYMDQEFWAENGLIYIMDYRDGLEDDDRLEILTRPTWVARWISFNDEAKRMKYPDEKAERYSLLADMAACNKMAKAQGDPMDPEAARQKALENKRLIFVANFNPERAGRITSKLNAFASYTPDVAKIDKLPDILSTNIPSASGR